MADGMTRLYSLDVGDEFTFAPRQGRFRITEHFGEIGSRLIYEGLDLEAQKTTPKPVVAMSNWWVWRLSPEVEEIDRRHAENMADAVERERLGHDYYQED